jgi:hypothetical protein
MGGSCGSALSGPWLHDEDLFEKKRGCNGEDMPINSFG